MAPSVASVEADTQKQQSHAPTADRSSRRGCRQRCRLEEQQHAPAIAAAIGQAVERRAHKAADRAAGTESEAVGDDVSPRGDLGGESGVVLPASKPALVHLGVAGLRATLADGDQAAVPATPAMPSLTPATVEGLLAWAVAALAQQVPWSLVRVFIFATMLVKSNCW